MNSGSRFVLGLLFCATCGANASQRQPSAERPGRYLLPAVDEARQYPSLMSYRQRLLRAVENRDAETVIAEVAPEIRPEFQHRFAPRTIANPDWQNMADVLRLGGSFTTTRGKLRGRREFCAPYTYTLYPKPAPVQLLSRPDGGLDPWVIIGERVPFRAEPRANSPVLAYLTHELVEVRLNATKGWQGVFVGDQAGWVPSDQIRGPEDFHICFAMLEDKWRLVEFEDGYVRW